MRFKCKCAFHSDCAALLSLWGMDPRPQAARSGIAPLQTQLERKRQTGPSCNPKEFLFLWIFCRFSLGLHEITELGRKCWMALECEKSQCGPFLALYLIFSWLFFTQSLSIRWKDYSEMIPLQFLIYRWFLYSLNNLKCLKDVEKMVFTKRQCPWKSAFKTVIKEI